MRAIVFANSDRLAAAGGVPAASCDAVARVHSAATHKVLTWHAVVSQELEICNLNCLHFYDRARYQKHYLGGIDLVLGCIFALSFRPSTSYQIH